MDHVGFFRSLVTIWYFSTTLVRDYLWGLSSGNLGGPFGGHGQTWGFVDSLIVVGQELVQILVDHFAGQAW